MFSLRDFPLWFYKIFTLKNLQTIYPSNSYNLFRKLLSLSEQATFSNRAGCFLFSSRLLSLFEQTTFSFRADYIHSPTYQIPQEKTQEQAKAHSILQAKPTTFLQAKAHNLSTSKSQQPSTNKVHNLSTSKSQQPSTNKTHSLQQAKPTATPHP